MRRDVLLLTEMIEAAEQAQELTRGISAGELEADRQRRDALLWNFTVLGEAAGQLSEDIKNRFTEIAWQQPVRLRNRIVHGYWSVDMESCIRPPASSSRHSSPTFSMFSKPSAIAPDLGEARGCRYGCMEMR